MPRTPTGMVPSRVHSGMFEATANVALFDYFRVPYEQNLERSPDLPPGVEMLRIPAQERFVGWPKAELLAADRRPGSSCLVDATPIFGHLAHQAEVSAWQRAAGGRWTDTHELRSADGTAVAAITRREDGSILLPFDPNELIVGYWSERYLEHVRAATINRLTTLARAGYYRARPLLPRSVQMGMRRSFRRLQAKAQFPRWPIEPALHDLYDFLFALLIAFAERPIPYVAPWPRNWSWALVLTHDVESRVGYESLADLLELELELGYRSSWNFVPRGPYTVDAAVLQSLTDGGFEVGVHGLHHDGRDLTPATVDHRLPLMQQWGREWGARGFRSPATLRSAALIEKLGFDYDSSYSDTAPFEPQAGGCCTWLPYHLGDVVELPITVVQDHTLFEILGHDDGRIWLEKTLFLRHRGGMALFLTHPDYVNGRLLGAYRSVLENFAGDATAWKALPSEVADWWARRSQSTLHDSGEEWCIVGPAEGDARIEFMSAHTPPA